MSSVVADLEAGLQAMLNLKPPGVSGSRIAKITALCIENVQSESVIIQKMFTHFKKTPGTHKLGVLYVVDSVTRKWMDQAKAHGQPISSAAQDGTFAAGVHRVTELMPVLMSDIIASAPDDQKEKIKKLIDIWDKGQTFPPSMLTTFKEKLAQRPQNASTTPPGSPPPDMLASVERGQRSGPASTATDAANIMAVLANMTRQNASAASAASAATASQTNQSQSMGPPTPAPTHAPVLTAAVAPVSAPTSAAALASLLRAAHAPGSNSMPPTNGMSFMPSNQAGPPPVNVSASPYGYPVPAHSMPPAHLSLAGAMNGTSNQANSFVPPAQAPASASAANPQIVQLVAALAAQGMPVDKIASIVRMVVPAQNGAAPAVPPPHMPQLLQTGGQLPFAAPTSLGAAPWGNSRPDEARDRTINAYHDSMLSPNRMHDRSRSRSRSPRRWGSREPQGRFEYGRDSPSGRGRSDDRDERRVSDYRQRSPPRRVPSPPAGRDPHNHEKWIEIDNSLPDGTIKVYSRTLFVGGVTCSEGDLLDAFSRYGMVQTCIVNKDKRHAFVKMYFRKDAERAKKAMEDGRGVDTSLRTRWGVGFGPRDCSDYASGVSVIPIHKLTDADRKWMLTAPFGGSGGRPIVSGMCVEEPDIEIGAGVSSKAISRRMQTDKSGNHGPKSSRRDDDSTPGSQAPQGNVGGGGSGGGGGGSRGSRWQRRGRDNHRGDNKREDKNNDEPSITMGPNGINYPPNFAFGGKA